MTLEAPPPRQPTAGIARTLAVGVLACLLGLVPCQADAQRAADFHQRVRQYVVHDAPAIRIDDVRVIDGTGAPARVGQSILLRDGKIVRIGPVESMARETADVVIEGKGRSVMPGLVMMHEHLLFPDPLADAPSYLSEPLASPKAYLAWGATTIRTAGTFNGSDDIQVARMIREGQFVGPDINVTAPFLEGNGSFAYQMVPIVDPARARQIVNFWADAGATSFKIYMNLSREVLAAAIDEAHKRGLQVTGHLCSITFHEAAAAGIDGLEHGLVVATDFVADKKADRCPAGSAAGDALLALKADGPEIDELISTLVRRKVAVTSTLAVFAAGIVNWFPATDDLAMLNEQSQLWAWQRMTAINRAPERRERGARLLQAEMQFEKAFVAAGGTLLVGTDPTGWGGTLPGPGNHAAIRLLVEAGFTPLEAIRIATYAGAKFQGIDNRVGTLAVGKQADLLLIDGKPDEDITQLGRIDLVFKNGIAFDPKRLKESLRGKIGR
jgi:imidazolonepropionase-like amidohydrolase